MLAMKTRMIEEETLTMTQLQRTLLENRIPILDNDEVEAYKAKALWRYKAKGIAVTWFCAGLIAGLFACGFWYRLCASINATGFNGIFDFSVAMICGCTVLASVILAVKISREFRSGLLAAWNTNSLAWFIESERHIPHAVKEMGEQLYLATYGNASNVNVEWLGPDPFLWVSDPEVRFGPRYYLMVWDEKGFFPHAVPVQK